MAKTLAALAVGFVIGGAVFILPRLGDSTPKYAELPQRHQIPRPTATMTVASAYAQIPHRRTSFRPNESEISDEETRYLQLAFATIDQAIVRRVTAMRAFQQEDYDRSYIDNYTELYDFFCRVAPPKKLRTYHKCVLRAMEAQIEYLTGWQSNGGGFVESHRQVQRASDSLHRAYEELMEAFPNVSETNRNAFFDHHCALDFI